MNLRNTTIRVAFVLGCMAASVAVLAQLPFSDPARRALVSAPAVQYLFPEQITVPAGKPTAVELHFRVAPGLHINSHTPRDKYLIPTTITVPESSGVSLANAVYPEGEDFVLPADPGNKLSVYTGEFVVKAHLVARPGDHLVQARLRYQACDNNECMPPKTATVVIDVIGK